MAERILGVDHELASAYDMSASSYFWNDGFIGPESCRLDNSTSKGRSQNTLCCKGISNLHFPPGIVKGSSGAQACSSRAPVNLAVGENADIPAVMGRVLCFPDDDGPVKKSQVLLEGMPDGGLGHDRLFDQVAHLDESPEELWQKRYPKVLCPAKCIKGPPEGNIISHSSNPGHIDLLVKHTNKGGDVEERDRFHLAAGDLGECLDLSGRRVDLKDRLFAIIPDQASFERSCHQGDDSMSTHRAEPLVMEEQDSEVTVRGNRLSQDTPVHVGMTPRLPHERCPEFVEMLLGIATFLDDCLAWNRGQAFSDDPQRLAGGMGIDRLDEEPAGRWIPISGHFYIFYQ